MAVKTEAQVRTLVRALSVDLLDNLRTYCNGDFTTDINAVTTAIAAGDDQPEDATQTAAVNTLIASLRATYEAALALCRSVHPSLGRLASSDNLGRINSNMQAFTDWLETNSKSVDSRGFTRFSSWSADGSNVGDGTFVVLNTDPSGETIDISHIETLTLECVNDAQTGNAREGAEQFLVYGEALADYPWEEGGSGRTQGASYRLPRGQSLRTFDTRQAQARTGQVIDSIGFAQTAGNIAANGNIESGLNNTSANNAPTGWTYVSGGLTLTLETSNFFRGTQSLAIPGDGAWYYDLTGRVRALTAYAIQVYVRVPAGVTAGNVILKVKDDSTDHATITVDTTGLANDTWTKGSSTGAPFIMPSRADTSGTGLRLELSTTSYAGSGNILVDGIQLVPLTLVDGRAVGILQGATDWTNGDKATGQTTVSEAGSIQRMFNEAFGRSGFRGYVEHASTGTDWTDA